MVYSKGETAFKRGPAILFYTDNYRCMQKRISTMGVAFPEPIYSQSIDT